MNNRLIYNLIRKYNAGKCSAEERLLLEQWYLSIEWGKEPNGLDENELLQLKNNTWYAISAGKNSSNESPVLVREMPGKKFDFNWRRVAAAAVIIIMLSGTGYFIFNKNTAKERSLVSIPANAHQNDREPGHDNAILTLADGTTIELDSAVNGTLANQGGIKVIKLDGQIAYDATDVSAKELIYNTITTAKGNQYQLVLADGSKVWLNAASSIRFPMTFAGRERRVEITGEAYFEVAQLQMGKAGQEKIPFIVTIASTEANKTPREVQVLGTHFNINAYDDEATIKTTLLEGSVKVNNGYASKIIAPGQQAIIAEKSNPSSPIQVNVNIDTDEVVAWKNGIFNFNSSDIQTIMRQIARWYDVEVSFEGIIPAREFSGKISRNNKASNVLKVLAESDIHFRIENKKIIVMP